MYMTVACIGDRGAGKTHLILELANPNYRNVRVEYPDFLQLKLLLYDEKSKSTLATDASKPFHKMDIKFEVKLPSKLKKINVSLLDNSGEVWRKYWQETNHDKWQHFLEEFQKISAVILVLEPYRDIIREEDKRESYITLRQWVNRFNNWTEFLISQGRNLKHIVVCISKADLLLNYPRELMFFDYDPRKSGKSIALADEYTSKAYLSHVADQIALINRSLDKCLPVKSFLTTIYKRETIELPFIYLASYLD